MYDEAPGWDDAQSREHKEEIVGNPVCFFCHGKTIQITHTPPTYIAHCSKHLLVAKRSLFLNSIRILG